MVLQNSGRFGPLQAHFRLLAGFDGSFVEARSYAEMQKMTCSVGQGNYQWRNRDFVLHEMRNFIR